MSRFISLLLLLAIILTILLPSSDANYFYIPGHESFLVPNNASFVWKQSTYQSSRQHDENISPGFLSYSKSYHYTSPDEKNNNVEMADNNGTITYIDSFEISRLQEHCKHSSYAHVENHFLTIVNGCYLAFDPENIYLKMLRDFSLWCLTWINGWFVSRILFLLMLSSGFLFGFYSSNRITKNLVVRRAFYLLEWGHLLLRVSTILSFTVWALAPVRQPSPCACYYSGRTLSTMNDKSIVATDWISPFESVLGNAWNFPAANTIAAMTIALYLMERYNILLGLALAVALPALEIGAGLASLGAVIPAVFLGVVFYLYHRFTPPIMRFVDIAINIILGVLGIMIPKQFPIYKYVPYDFVDVYLEGQIFQLFVLCMWLTQFSPGFLKFILLRRPHTYTMLDLEFFPFHLLPNVELSDTDGYQESDVFDELDQKRSYSTKTGMSMFTRFWDKRWLVILISIATFALLAFANVLSFWTRNLYFGLIK